MQSATLVTYAPTSCRRCLNLAYQTSDIVLWLPQRRGGNRTSLRRRGCDLPGQIGAGNRGLQIQNELWAGVSR